MQYAIEEKTDEEIAEHLDTDEIIVGNINANDWRLIVKFKAVPYVLNHIESDGWPSVVSDLLPLIRSQNFKASTWKEKLTMACFDEAVQHAIGTIYLKYNLLI